MKKCHKALNFDLDTHLLEEYYPGKHYNNAYRDIGRFLNKNGFFWRSGSGYVSLKKLSDIEIRSIVVHMSEKYSWLKYCVKQFDATDIGKQHSLLGPICDTAPTEPEPPASPTRKPALNDTISSAEQKRDEQQRGEGKSQNIENIR